VGQKGVTGVERTEQGWSNPVLKVVESLKGGSSVCL